MVRMVMTTGAMLLTTPTTRMLVTPSTGIQCTKVASTQPLYRKASTQISLILTSSGEAASQVSLGNISLLQGGLG